MKIIFLGLLAGIWISVNTQAAPVVLDLSRSHMVDDLKKSGLVMKEISGGTGEQDFAFENQEVEIRLPGGRSIQQMVILGIIDSKDDLLTRFSITGDVMPHDQAIQVAKIFHQSFGLETSELDAWYKNNIGKVRNAEPYSISANLKFYPRIGITIRQSMNDLYPWVIGLSISWEWDKQRDWNEERVWSELPPSAIAVISLNPPSGQKYERRDAYKESLEEQKSFEQELAAKGQAPTPTMTPSSSSPTATPKSSLVVQAESLKSFSWSWIIVAIFLLIVTGGVFILFLRE